MPLVWRTSRSRHRSPINRREPSGNFSQLPSEDINAFVVQKFLKGTLHVRGESSIISSIGIGGRTVAGRVAPAGHKRRRYVWEWVRYGRGLYERYIGQICNILQRVTWRGLSGIFPVSSRSRLVGWAPLGDEACIEPLEPGT